MRVRAEPALGQTHLGKGWMEGGWGGHCTTALPEEPDGIGPTARTQ